MNLRQKVLGGSLVLSLGEGIGYGASFGRNLILARLLTKADFGIAATFAMIISLVEITTKLGLSTLLIRDKDGDDPKFVSTVHLIAVTAGVVSASVLAAASPWLARLFGIPDLSWALALLAIPVILRGSEHADIRRFERHLRYAPAVLAGPGAQVVVMLAAWPVAVWLGDFRAVLVLLATKSLITCVASHLLAERPYRWHWHREYVIRMLRFGWPLLLTGFLMFGVMQGEQFLVATFYRMEELAPYAAALALVMAPLYMFGRVFNSVSLPLLARVQDDPVALVRRYRQVIGGTTLFASLLASGLILGGEAIIQLLYGQKYAGAGVLMGWLAAAASFRCIRTATTMVALAKGDSKNQLIANLVRLSSLTLALAAAWAQQPLWMIACTGVLGELLAFGVSIYRLRWRDGVPLRVSLVPAAIIVTVVVAAGLAFWGGIGEWPVRGGLLLATLGAIIAGAGVVLLLPEVRAEVLRMKDVVRSGRWREMLSQKDAPAKV